MGRGPAESLRGAGGPSVPSALLLTLGTQAGLPLRDSVSPALSNSKETEARTGPGTADRSHSWREGSRGSCVPSLPPPPPSSAHFRVPSFLSPSPPSGPVRLIWGEGLIRKRGV